jgi:hypothetical protein
MTMPITMFLPKLPVLGEAERSCLARYLARLAEQPKDDSTAAFLANVAQDGICVYRR